MNAVNLLPAKHRPRTPTGGQQGSSYAVIGILGVVCVMVLLYVLTVNGINTSKQSIQKTETETAQAKKRAEELAPYGNFIQIKEQRVASVKQLATGRIDWERLARGLAHVLPDKVWLLTASAAAAGDPGSGGGQSAAPPPPAPTGNGGGGASGSPAPSDPSGGAGAPKPSLQLKGCAVNHPAVAVTLVRLRHLPAVEDVELSSIMKPEVTVGTGAGAGSGGDGGSSEDCGRINKKAVYTWEAKVTFKPQAGSTPTAPEKKVPAALGGGA